jgi:CRP-like cAMP-binding protein
MNHSHDDTTILPSAKLALALGEGIRRNRLLGALSAAELETLLPSLESVPLVDGMPIYAPHEPITRVYFPTNGIISLVSEMAEGTVEVGTIGREGMTGLPLVLHATTMPGRAFVQVPGHAYRMQAEDLLAAMRASPRFERLLFRSVLALYDQTAQHAACNRLHTLEERCARWLLMTHDRVDGDVLLLKQQFLAEMLGVHRPAVTIAAGALQRAGIIRYSRGKVTVLDRDALERSACKCYAIIARRAEELLDLEELPERDSRAGYETVRN